MQIRFSFLKVAFLIIRSSYAYGLGVSITLTSLSENNFIKMSRVYCRIQNIEEALMTDQKANLSLKSVQLEIVSRVRIAGSISLQKAATYLIAPPDC
ncbi:hypothetical protein CDAR_78681 [Caerostris darwini]|uniref:Uncharacterized protein n=1 Tax=Caerostris darwini TaxID=1538125 RepID=A0AAV4QRV2_9ARAC|nr:hypothetical protein CDAR_78681 [Caerostris darwini]